MHDIRVVGNLFLGGRDTIVLDSLESDLCRGITIANNSFYRATNWLVPSNSSGAVEGVVVVNNWLFEPGGLDAPGGDLAALAAAGWRFAGNLAEREGPECPLAASHPRLDVLSRDPSDPRFLRPAAGSLLATSGLGGDWPSYAGALAPDPPDRPAPAGRRPRSGSGRRPRGSAVRADRSDGNGRRARGTGPAGRRMTGRAVAGEAGGPAGWRTVAECSAVRETIGVPVECPRGDGKPCLDIAIGNGATVVSWLVIGERKKDREDRTWPNC